MEPLKPLFLQLSRADQKASLEALIFSSEEPVTSKSLFNVLIVGNYGLKNNSENFSGISDAIDSYGKKNNSGSQHNGFDNLLLAEEALDKYDFSLSFFDELIHEINKELLETNRPFSIIRIAGGWQYCTRKEFGELIHHLIRGKNKRRLSQAAMETLAIIAYKQPVTKPEIDNIRGVSSGDVVNSLMEKSLVEIKGRSESLGKPLIYGTTTEFMKLFGINKINELPKLREMEEFAKIEEEIESQNRIDLNITDENQSNVKNLN